MRHYSGFKNLSLVVLLRGGIDADEFLRRLDEQTEEGLHDEDPAPPEDRVFMKACLPQD